MATDTELIEKAASPFFVAHAKDRFGREFAFWAVWYRDRLGALRQTGDEPLFLRWSAKRLARRYNEGREASRAA